MDGTQVLNRRKVSIEGSTTLPHKSAKFFLHISQLILYFFASNLLISSAVFIVGGKITPLLFTMSMVSAVLLLILFYDSNLNRRIIIEILIFTVLLMISIGFSGMIIDSTYDGNSYHKVAVGLLRNGWNPVFELPSGSVMLDVLKTNATHDIIWVESYGKAAWVFGASIYAVVGSIECGKAYTLLSMFCVFGLTFYFGRYKGKNALFCSVLSFIAALNPIAVAQLDSFYVDGFLHEVLYLLVLSLFINLQDDSMLSSATSASLVASAMLVCSNIKFTGMLYGGIYCIVYFLFYCIREKKKDHPDWTKNCVKRCMAFTVLALCCIIWAGAPTYMTNLIRHGTFTYPITGNQPVDIMTPNSSFSTVNHFRNWFISLFSKMGNYFALTDAGTSPQLKIPFSVDFNTELEYLLTPDTRISGFGLFFSGLFLVAIIVTVIKLFQMKKDESFYLCFVNTAVNFIICFAISESWWARYAPYNYFVLLTGLYFILDNVSHYDGRKKIATKTVATLISVLCIINSLLFLKGTSNGINYSRTINHMITELNTYDKIYIDCGTFPGACFNLLDAGVNYEINYNLIENEQSNNLYYMGIQWQATY